MRITNIVENLSFNYKADKDSKVITRQEIDDYSAWLEANPAPVVSTVEETLTL